MDAAFSARLRRLALTPAQWVVLNEVASSGSLAQHQLSSQTGIDPATLAEMLRRMTVKLLVHREVDPSDARAQLVHLGEAVHDELLSAATRSAKEVNRQALAGFSQEEKMTLLDMLERVRQNMDAV